MKSSLAFGKPADVGSRPEPTSSPAVDGPAAARSPEGARTGVRPSTPPPAVPEGRGPSGLFAARGTSDAGRSMFVLGARLQRSGPPILRPRGAETAVGSLVAGIFTNRGAHFEAGIQDHRSPEAARDAVDSTLIAIGSPLGPVTFYRPGLGNTSPSAAFIARLAQYTDKLVLAYANPGEASEARLRMITQVDGTKLPESLEGRVFAIGSSKNLMISFDQASDLFLEQLEQMKRSQLLGSVELTRSRATVIAHGAGALDVLLARRRLEHAGQRDVFGRFAAIAAPFRGSAYAAARLEGLIAQAGDHACDLQSIGAVNALLPEHVTSVFGEQDERLVDVSLVARTRSSMDGRTNIRSYFRPQRQGAATPFAASDGQDDDGWVPVDSQLFGSTKLLLTRSYDHAGVVEDPSVIDRLVRGLLDQDAARSVGS